MKPDFAFTDLSKHISQRQILESQLTENKFVKEVNLKNKIAYSSRC